MTNLYDFYNNSPIILSQSYRIKKIPHSFGYSINSCRIKSMGLSSKYSFSSNSEFIFFTSKPRNPISGLAIIGKETFFSANWMQVVSILLFELWKTVLGSRWGGINFRVSCLDSVPSPPLSIPGFVRVKNVKLLSIKA